MGTTLDIGWLAFPMRPVISVRNNNITEVVNLLKIFQTEVILYNNKVISENICRCSNKISFSFGK